MKLDREIVDRFLAGQEIADSWVFSEIEEDRRCFDLSDATGREREIRELTQQVSERINVFVPENAEVYRQLFPNRRNGDAAGGGRNQARGHRL